MATIVVRDELIARAREISGITDASKLVELSLEMLVRQKVARHLADLGGSDPHAVAAPR